MELSCYQSLATLTATRVAPENDVINIDENNLSFDSLFILKGLVGITYDIVTGKFWAITGRQENEQKLREFCDNSKINIAAPIISNDDTQLFCLTSGVSGLYAINLLDFKYGILDTSDGSFQTKGPLPATTDSSYDSYVFAQDEDGILHFINGDGDYFTKQRDDKIFKKVAKFTFPIVGAFCGDFIDDDTIAAVGLPGDGNILEFSISKRTATSRVVQSGAILTDVTNGPLSQVCPARSLTALADTNSNTRSAIVDIDSSSLKMSNMLKVDSSVGITQDLSTEKVYAITESGSLIRLCKSSSETIAEISPSDVELVCLTSGKRGVFAIDMNAKEFGKLNVNTGRFTSEGKIPGPYNAYAFAQDFDGVLHYVNGDGKHFDTSRDNNRLRASGVKFPSDKLGICGEFDGSDILAASTRNKGGTVRYSILKATTTVQIDIAERSYTDVTTGSITEKNGRCSSKSSKKSKKGGKSKKSSKASKTSIASSTTSVELNPNSVTVDARNRTVSK